MTAICARVRLWPTPNSVVPAMPRMIFFCWQKSTPGSYHEPGSTSVNVSGAGGSGALGASPVSGAPTLPPEVEPALPPSRAAPPKLEPERSPASEELKLPSLSLPSEALLPPGAPFSFPVAEALPAPEPETLPAPEASPPSPDSSLEPSPA